jgi:hypothetical protein
MPALVQLIGLIQQVMKSPENGLTQHECPERRLPLVRNRVAGNQSGYWNDCKKRILPSSEVLFHFVHGNFA